MLSLSSGVRIFIATKPMDMRKSLDGMAYLVDKELKKDVFSGQIFVFCNKRGDKIKIFYWDRNGYCCWYKRLEKGIFRMPKTTGSSFAISDAELLLLLEGIDLTTKSRLRPI